MTDTATETKITDDCLLCEHPHLSSIGSVQRVYRFKGGNGLSAVNSPMLHIYPFAWEIAVVSGLKDDGSFDALNYETPLTGDVEVFMNDATANEFIAKAKIYFDAGL